MLRPPRDHDIVEDVFGRISVVVGNLHPPNGLIAYVKYVRTDGKTLWSRNGVYYERVLKTYGVRSIHKYLPQHQELVYDPVLNTYVPVVNLRHVRSYYYPELRFQEILSKSEDELELVVLEFVDLLRSYIGGVGNSLGITGSLLTKTHNVKVSDIDIIIYGCKCSTELLGSIGNFTSLKPSYEMLVRQSAIYGLPPEVVGRIYPPFKRLLVRGRMVNIMFVDDASNPRYGSEIYVNLHPVELIVEALSYDCRSLYYPSITYIYKVIDIIYPKGVTLDYGRITSIVSYEGLYSYISYLGGRLRVRGILQRVIPTNKYRVLVGGIEEPGYIIPA